MGTSIIFMTRQLKLVVLTSLSAIFLSNVVHGNPSNGNACDPGFFMSMIQDEVHCQPCPSGSFSNSVGATQCEPCLDTIYDGEAANSAEILNGYLYCVNTNDMGDLDDDEFSPSSTPTGVPTRTTGVPSMEPSTPSFLIASNVPSSSFLSYFPTAKPSELDDFFETEESTGNEQFEWHGRYRDCPAQHYTIMFPCFLVLFLALIIGLLEHLIPSCYTSQVWWGIEYFHMLYLLGIAPIPWSPIAGFIFVRLVPIFAMDINASFSLQCILKVNWLRPEAADHLFTLSLPILSLILLTFISKASRGRILHDDSVSRWMTLVLCMGYPKFVLSSMEVLEFPDSLAADKLSVWTSSDPFYATMAGLVGCVIYGLGFPFWFIQSILRYHRLDIALRETEFQNNSNDIENDHDQKRSVTMKRKKAKRKKELFMTLGIFPVDTFGSRAWWWPGLLMLRKFIFAILLVIFTDRPFLLVVVCLMLHFLVVVLQQRFLLLNKEAESTIDVHNQKLSQMRTVDTVLQISFAAMIGIAFFSLWTFQGEENNRSGTQKWMEDSMVLAAIVASSLYLLFVIGSCCVGVEPRFLTVASQMVDFNLEGVTDHINGRRLPSSVKGDELKPIDPNSGLIFHESYSTTSSSSNGDIEYYQEPLSSGTDSDHQDASNFPFKIAETDFVPPWQSEDNLDHPCERPSPYVVGVDGEPGSNEDEEVAESMIVPTLFRGDSSIATKDEADEIGNADHEELDEDMKTVYEEVWIDEETGEQIEDPKEGNWMDAETGMRAVPLE